MFLCIDIGGTAIKYALFDGDNCLSEGEAPSGGGGAEALLNRLQDVCAQFAGLTAIGLDICGMVDAGAGTVRFAGNLDIKEEYPLCARLSDFTGVPVFIENDVNAAALGEARFGAGQGLKNFLCAAVGTGVGGAIVSEGRLMRGGNGMAGEIGHLITHPGGTQCTCGTKGCFERYASAVALVENAAAIEGSIQSGRDLFARIHEPGLTAALDGWLNELVLGLTSLVHVLDPEAVILGGGIMEQEIVLAGVRERLPKAVIPTFSGVKVLAAKLGNRAGVYGMLARCRDEIL